MSGALWKGGGREGGGEREREEGREGERERESGGEGGREDAYNVKSLSGFSKTVVKLTPTPNSSVEHLKIGFLKIPSLIYEPFVCIMKELAIRMASRASFPYRRQ